MIEFIRDFINLHWFASSLAGGLIVFVLLAYISANVRFYGSNDV